MALSRSQKEIIVERYQGGVGTATHAFLLDYKGVSANQVTELRAKIRESGGSYEVVKNRLLLLAIEGQPLEAMRDQLQGPTAIAYTEDPVQLAKILTDFVKDVPTVELKGGIVEGSAITAEQVQEIAKLPSRDELMAKLLFLMQSPITRLARGLAAIPRQFVVVIDQVAQGKEA